MNEAGFIPENAEIAQTEAISGTPKADRENKTTYEETDVETEMETAAESETEEETQEELFAYVRSIDSRLSEVSETLGTVQETAVNIEYDSAMQFVVLSVGVGLLALLTGFFLARVIFRKL